MIGVDMQFTVTCCGAPLIIEGKIGELKLFYRSRHGRWRIELDDTSMASGPDENEDSQTISEALRLIGVHCSGEIWNHINIREETKWDTCDTCVWCYENP